MFIDSHAHITETPLDERKNEIIENMEKDNIGIIVNVGFDIENSKKNIELCKKGKVYASVGVHPHYAVKPWDKADSAEMLELGKKAGVVAVGEIGLDYHYEGFSAKFQKEYFCEQIDIADKLKLPLIIHVRNAEEDCRDILAENISKINNGLLFHCFNGSEAFMKWTIENIKNVFFAFGGQITYKHHPSIPALAVCPLDRLMLETDCPYLTPDPLRGKMSNEPKLISYVYAKAAEIKNITIKELESIAENNFKRFFKC